MKSRLDDLTDLNFPELAVVISGIVSMGLEILAGRMLAPEFGSGVYTWGSLIGIFMAALSLGYYVGGRRVERASKEGMCRIMLETTVYVVFLMISYEYIIQLVDIMPLGARYSSIPAVTILFGPPAYILGLLSPYAAQLSEKERKGEASGRVYALGTVGSIFGSFVTTFALIPFFDIQTVLLIFGATLLTFPLAYSDWNTRGVAALVALLLVGGYAMGHPAFSVGQDSVYQTQTPYQELEISDSDGVRTMYLNGQPNSAMYLNGSGQHAFDYTRYFHMPLLMTDDVDRVLFIGGGGFTGPKKFVDKYNVTVDVVEIDPEVVEASKQYFEVEESEDMNIHVMDGRKYLEQTDNEYDVIILDAYKKDEVPFHLTTEEFMELSNSKMDEDGVFMANLISAPQGPGSKFFRSEYKTMERTFPNVYAFPTSNSYLIQNIEVIATKDRAFSEEQILERNRNRDIGIDLSEEIQNYMTDIETSDVPVLTDNDAPVDRLLQPSAKEYVLEGENVTAG